MLVKLRLGQDFEQRCLAYLWQADDAGFHDRSVAALSGWIAGSGASTMIQERGSRP